MVCDKSPPMGSLNFATMLFKFSTGRIIISPSIFGMTKIRGKTPLPLEPPPMSQVSSDPGYLSFELCAFPVPPAGGLDGVADLSPLECYVALIAEVLG